MNILIKQARILSPASPHHGKTMDLLIEKGIITSIKPKISVERNIKTVESPGLHVSDGWLDMQVNFCDPGEEHKETIRSGTEAAAAGGFTGVAVTPGTTPPADSRAQVEYIRNEGAAALVDVFPVGAITKKLEGKELAEMYDMWKAGAVAFSDDKHPIAHAGVLMRALLYSANFPGGPVITYCDDKSISQDGRMNEGETSTKLGLKGIPALAEELMIARNLLIAEHTGIAVHISNVSTKGAVEMIREAKRKKIKVTASANAYSLALTDSLLTGFDTNYKLSPPLRTKADVEALRAGISDRTIDVITSDHRPQDIESKQVEFDHAADGMIGLQTAFGLLNTHRGNVKLDRIIETLSSGPRSVLRMQQPELREKEPANITIFDPELDYTFRREHNRSKSANTPFIGTTFKGKVIGVVNNRQVWLSNY